MKMLKIYICIVLFQAKYQGRWENFRKGHNVPGLIPTGSSSSLFIVNKYMLMYILHVNIIVNINLKLILQ